MKIGIITWFTGSNYGTNLQAIALQYYLRTQGYDVKIINYEIQSSYNDTKKTTILERILAKKEYITYNFALKKFKEKIAKRDENLKDNIIKKCNLTEKIETKEKLIEVCNSFDLLICGSDQIWNPNWYDKFYYADYEEINTRKISYAPSMGVNEIQEKVMEQIASSIEKFDCVSVREEKAAELLRPYIIPKPEVVVDPTLLLNSEEWKSIFPQNLKKQDKEKYVLSMFLTDNYNHWKAAKKFASKHGLKQVIIPYCGLSYFQKGEIVADAGLTELLDLIRNAEYVLTDSFHITVFSIINHKQFYTFQRFKENKYISQNIRITNLLKKSDLEDRIILYDSKKIFDRKDIEFTSCILKLQQEIQKSKSFLERAIQERKTK